MGPRGRLAKLAERAWEQSRGLTSATWEAHAEQGQKPERWPDYVGPWQVRLIRFAVRFGQECEAAGMDPVALLDGDTNERRRSA